MTMTTTASMEEALAAVADRDDAIGGGEASGGKTTIKNGGGEAGDGDRRIKRGKNGDDNVDNVRRRLPKTQQPAIGRGGEAVTKMTQRNSTAADRGSSQKPKMDLQN